MKIKCSKMNFVKGLQAVARAVSTKNTVFALSGIYMEASGSELILQATDMEIAIEYRDDDLIIEEEGGLLLPGRYLLEIAKKLPDTDLLIATEQNTLFIRYGNSEIEINGFGKEEFPALPKIEGTITGTFSLEVFRKAIKEVSTAVSLDETRPIFTGILFDISGDSVKIVGTDTHRLALRSCTWSACGEKRDAAVIVPNRVLQELVKFGDDSNPNLEVVVADKQISFRLDNLLIVSRLIEGKFPNYLQVIPEADKVVATAVMSREELLSALERASVMIREQMRDRVGRVHLSLSESMLAVESQAAEVGRIHEELLVNHEGEDVNVLCNSRHLLDILRVLEDDEVVISFTGAVKPMILRVRDNDAYLYLMLPLKP